jgi:hypothetical protein
VANFSDRLAIFRESQRYFYDVTTVWVDGVTYSVMGFEATMMQGISRPLEYHLPVAISISLGDHNVFLGWGLTPRAAPQAIQWPASLG